MDLLHEHVHHGRFGGGTVTGQTERMVEVEFGEEYGCRKFQYPAAFEKFLSLDDPAAHGKMEDELKRADAALEALRRQRREEQEQRQEEERQEALEKKRTAAKKRTTAKKAGN